MTTSDIIAVVSLTIALTSFMISIFTNTKKFELKSSTRAELLNWYATTLEDLIMLKEYTFSHVDNKPYKVELLAKLSTQIEIGRFFFPNRPCGDFGTEKPLAYQGHRNIMLEFLVYSYDIYKKDNPEPYIRHAIGLQRLFTSEMMKILPPHEHNKSVMYYTGLKINPELSLEEYLASDPKHAFSLFGIN